MPHGEGADRDPVRSYARLDKSDLVRLGRAAQAELEAFFARNPHLAGWRTGCASSPSRKAAPSITCAAAAGYEISTSSSASRKTTGHRKPHGLVPL
jgi:hypothetical protein